MPSIMDLRTRKTNTARGASQPAYLALYNQHERDIGHRVDEQLGNLFGQPALSDHAPVVAQRQARQTRGKRVMYSHKTSKTDAEHVSTVEPESAEYVNIS